MRWRMVALTAAIYALVGACGAGGDPGGKVASLSQSATPSNGQSANDGKTDEDRMREYAKCMGDHGIEVEEPKTEPGQGGKGGGIGIKVEAGQEGKLEEAEKACNHLLPNGGKPKPVDAATLDKMREHAKCLRDNGLDVPDPDPNSPGITVKENDPDKANKAFAACKHIMGEDGPMLEGKDSK
jgi:hypothetical protein